MIRKILLALFLTAWFTTPFLGVIYQNGWLFVVWIFLTILLVIS